MEDKQIISLFLNRDEKAIVETSHKYGAYCNSISYNILKNREDSEECVNDTYVKTWNSVPPKIPLSLSAYLGKIIRNISLNLYKRKHTAKRGGYEIPLVLDELSEVIAGENNVVDTIYQKENEKAIIKVLNKFLYGLDKQSRNICIRRYFYMDSISEISKKFVVSESKVKSLLFRSRKKLKIQFEQEDILC